MRQGTTFTATQAGDLARYFLGPEWNAEACFSRNVFVYTLTERRPDGSLLHLNERSWRGVFRLAGVKLPVRRHFVAIGTRVMLADKRICDAYSTTLALRIANALEEYLPGPKGY